MRYPKGTVIVSRTRDIPVLEHVLRCGFVTRGQLFEFLWMDRLEWSRAAFEQRVRRLEKLELIRRHSGLLSGHEWVYSIAPKGARLLTEMGEPYGGRGVQEPESGQIVVNHWLEINDIHLALRRDNLLVRWTPESEIRSQNDLTTFGYTKDYDAVVTVKCENSERRFALEYERSVKTSSKYEEICARLDKECHVNIVLYLLPTYHVLSFVKQCFVPKRTTICLAVARDFLELLLDTPVIVAGQSGATNTFKDVLVRTREDRHIVIGTRKRFG